MGICQVDIRELEVEDLVLLGRPLGLCQVRTVEEGMRLQCMHHHYTYHLHHSDLHHPQQG